MKQAPTAEKIAQTPAPTASSDTAAGPDGLAIAPPYYGIDVVDRRSVQALPAHRQENPPAQSAAGWEAEHASSAGLIIQPKLTIGAVGDEYEQEADRMARQVVSQVGASASPSTPIPHRLGQGAKPPQLKRLIQRRADGGVAAAPGLETAIHEARGGGQSLAERIRQPMEQAFRADFRQVRIHTDAQSDRLNRSIQAKAFTTGQHIFFQRGAYAPDSQQGQELVAHELAHVVQQRGGGSGRGWQHVQRIATHNGPPQANTTVWAPQNPVVEPDTNQQINQASEVEAHVQPHDAKQKGNATVQGHDPLGWYWLRQAVPPQTIQHTTTGTTSTKYAPGWVRFHLLNHELGGDGRKTEHLVPAEHAVNTGAAWKSNFEGAAKEVVYNKGLPIHYYVTVTFHNTTPHPPGPGDPHMHFYPRQIDAWFQVWNATQQQWVAPPVSWFLTSQVSLQNLRQPSNTAGHAGHELVDITRGELAAVGVTDNYIIARIQERTGQGGFLDKRITPATTRQQLYDLLYSDIVLSYGTANPDVFLANEAAFNQGWDQLEQALNRTVGHTLLMRVGNANGGPITKKASKNVGQIFEQEKLASPFNRQLSDAQRTLAYAITEMRKRSSNYVVDAREVYKLGAGGLYEKTIGAFDQQWAQAVTPPYDPQLGSLPMRYVDNVERFTDRQQRLRQLASQEVDGLYHDIQAKLPDALPKIGSPATVKLALQSKIGAFTDDKEAQALVKSATNELWNQAKQMQQQIWAQQEQEQQRRAEEARRQQEEQLRRMQEAQRLQQAQSQHVWQQPITSTPGVGQPQPSIDMQQVQSLLHTLQQLTQQRQGSQYLQQPAFPGSQGYGQASFQPPPQPYHPPTYPVHGGYQPYPQWQPQQLRQVQYPNGEVWLVDAYGNPVQRIR